MNITRSWKPFVAVGCSHAHHIDPVARSSVLKFIKSYIPPQAKRRGGKVIHLGDFTDMEAFMGGGAGQGEPIAPDIEEGIAFLEEGGFNVILPGNHEDRLWRLCASSNEVVAECASMLKGRIEKCAKQLGAEMVPYTGIFQKYMLGTGLFTHGTIFNENSARDMGEIYVEADCVFGAHTHCPALAMARTTRRTMSINVGTLKQYGKSDYAKNRRKTLSWGQAIAYGEYCDTAIMPSLYVQPLAATLAGEEWRLPY